MTLPMVILIGHFVSSGDVALRFHDFGILHAMIRDFGNVGIAD